MRTPISLSFRPLPGSIAKQGAMEVRRPRFNMARFTEIGGGTDIPSVSNEDSGPSAVILRNHQNTVSKLSESAAGNSILSHCDPHFIYDRQQVNSYRSGHIKDWKQELDRMHPVCWSKEGVVLLEDMQMIIDRTDL
jgi:hypothetical protein